LAKRFQLKVHRVVKELPVYELVIDRNGPRLTAVSNDTARINKEPSTPKSRMPMEPLVRLISVHLDRPVIDKTGLAGKLYEFQFDQISLANCRPGDEALDCVSSLVREQLGLKLNGRKDSIEAVMVDHIERPTQN
ncbi:MAG TPA: TIGR03435 family protein, partial [Bryobacteraceae bacterium]|nr:TIGR03435 family protein [Bryobacteraceae bacterium]